MPLALGNQIDNWTVFIIAITNLMMSRDSAVGIGTGYGLDDRGVGV
jgi:hypothetical protein